MTNGELVAHRPLDTSALRLRVQGLLPALAALVVLAIGVTAVDGYPVGAVRDDSMYVLLAKSLATGHGYRWLHLPGTPAATHFPPGYPAFLALLWRLYPAFPENVVLFKLANVGLSALSAFFVAQLVRRRFEVSEATAQGFAIATMIAAPMLTLATQVMSEPLFLALVLLSLILAEEMLAPSERRGRDLILIGAVAGAATLVRTHGIALVAGIALALCLRRRFRDAAVFTAIVLVLLLPWELWVALHANVFPEPMRGNYESYLALVTDAVRARGISLLAQAALRTGHDLGVMFQWVIAPLGSSVLRDAALLVLGLLTSLGVRPVWRRMPATTLFLALYMAVVLVWPYTPGRFVWCIWPLLLILPAAGARELLVWAPSVPWERFARVGLAGAAAGLALGYAAYNVSGYRNHSWSTGGYAAFLRPLLVQVASRTPRNALIASEAEGTVYLYTGRRTVPLGSFMATDYLSPRTPHDYARAMSIVLDRYHPSAVFVTTGFLRTAMRDLAVSEPPRLAVVDTFPGGGLVLVPTSR